MPSWRKGQDRLIDEKFIKTDFYKNLSDLINNNDFIALIKNEKLTINLYLHHNFQRYSGLFNSIGINVISESDISIQKLLISHGLLITDFSSVALDFALQNRPVFYYQLDKSLSDQLDKMKNFLPGNIYWEKAYLFKDIKLTLSKDELAVAKPEKLDNLYLQRDTNANKRILKVIIDLLDENKNIKLKIRYKLSKNKRLRSLVKFMRKVKKYGLFS